MRAARREPVDQLPVWLMRQAGRYLPEYQKIRGDGDFLSFCKDPARCAEVMRLAVERLGVDAAILFTDLLVVLEPIGLQLRYGPAGPRILNPIRAPEDVKRLKPLEDLKELGYVLEAIARTREVIPPELPLIGFAGAPFTLAAYAIEGESDSKGFVATKKFMYQHEDAWFELLELLAVSVGQYLLAQIAAGVSAVQIFDTWVGQLGPDDYEMFVLEPTRRLFAQLPPEVPAIHFATGNPALLPLLDQAGGTVMGLDWRIRLADAWQWIGHRKAVQGNLDPAALLGPPQRIREAVLRLLEQWNGRSGYIFNLGHGVLPQTPVENVEYLVKLVHEESRRLLERNGIGSG
jgi:uroporphyrinogen decarboxylase